MPRDCEKYRLQLIIEYNRVLAWGKAAGLVDVPKGSTLGATLGAEGIELVAILARIQWLLSEFRELNARYGNELNPYTEDNKDKKKKDEDEDSEEDIKDVPTEKEQDLPLVDGKGSDLDIAKEISSLALSYEKQKEERKHLRGTNHIRKFFSKTGHHTKDIITHPSRVRWLVIDQEEFEKLLTDLHFLTERLHELMRIHHEKKIDDITAKTYREMILTRNDVQDLRDMFDAVSSLITASDSVRKQNPLPPPPYNQADNGQNLPISDHNNKTLQDLIQIKKLSRTSDSILAKLRTDSIIDHNNRLSSLNISVRKLSPKQLDQDFEWNEDVDYPPSLSRPRGIFTTPEGDIPVWVEWKKMGSFLRGSLRDREAALRTLALAEMLHLPKPESLCAPKCIAYFDDRDVSGADRYGWVFRMPEGGDYDTRVVSLYSLLGDRKFRPGLGERIKLAERLCSTILNLHAVNWIHKGVLSKNVVFCFNDHPLGEGEEGGGGSGGGGTGGEGFLRLGLEYDAGAPLLTGFEFSRPDNTDHTTQRDVDVAWDLYRWPGIQRLEVSERTSRKTYDLYSLGLVLMEVAHWERLEVLMGFTEKGNKEERVSGKEVEGEDKVPNVKLRDSKEVRGWLLGLGGEEGKEGASKPPFEVNPLIELKNVAGERYFKAVERCLWAHGEKGFGVEEWEVDGGSDGDGNRYGVVVQERFMDGVVEVLRGVEI